MPQSRAKDSAAAKPQSIRRALRGHETKAPEGLSVVALGASAGGLEAFRRFLDALPAGSGRAFVLVEHLDPTHDSLLVELLASHTRLTVLEAAEGMILEPEHLYIIPAGVDLTVGDGALHLAPPRERHGARLPFNILLHSLAETYGDRAVCIVLSGTGADGSQGLTSIHARGGWIIAQDPLDAAFDAMPRSAVATGLVDLVLAADKIPAALIEGRGSPNARSADHQDGGPSEPDGLPTIIELLHTKASHDFHLYKTGTLRRRIERRMAMGGIAVGRMDLYAKKLESDENELGLLAKDLLINITRFFRDPEVFDLLERTTIRERVENHPDGQPLRVWTAGCSSGEETYSLTMLFREAIATAKRDIKLQVFASDLDPDAVATAREGLYPETIEAQVSAARLARFFTKEDHGYRISPDLRATVVFTIQDVLADPPFSRLDMISCRNLLIYLSPEAQAKVLALFHFALLPNGLLLLGGSETAGNAADRFEIVAKGERLYRRIGKSRVGDLGFSKGAAETPRPARLEPRAAPSGQIALAELCRRLVIEAFAPAAILINARNECLFSLGPTDRFLRVTPGHPTQDILAMARPGLRTKLRGALQLAARTKGRVVVPGGRIGQDEDEAGFDIAVQPVAHEGEDLLLVCFVDRLKRGGLPARPPAPGDQDRVTELEQELNATKTELQSAIRNLEVAGEEQRAVNEEALSVNEEFQSTNEELMTSKEELQSLNEELTALNTQLQETLERQRTTSNDLQNVLYSTNIATLFLDADLNIRFFTPATKSLFNILPGDIGRPLADLHSLATDSALSDDAMAVLQRSTPIEREIEGQGGVWFIRRILPYRRADNAVEGVVITFTDITERKHSAKALEEAKQDADLANAAKSRFLAAASHDLRQPLQSLVLLQGLLAKTAKEPPEKDLIQRLDQTLGAMSGMLNTLLDINQIEAGVVRPEIVTFPIGDILDRLRDEFTYHAQAQGLVLKVIGCRRSIESDPRLLEQMMRNLISNALKYTPKGRILVGCRRRQGSLRVEIWDTGIGIAEKEHRAIFGEYHQIGNTARERSRGMGLGLSIVQRLADLLGHPVRVLSRPGKGSVFAIEVPTPEKPADEEQARAQTGLTTETGADAPSVKGKVLIVEDDPEVRDLLVLLLKGEGHRIGVASDGDGALEFIAKRGLSPDIILADYNLPNGMTGLETIAKIRERLHHSIPAVILTGDISTDTLRQVAEHNCIQINKPVKPLQLAHLIQTLLPAARARAPLHDPGPNSPKPTIFVIDDDMQVRDGLRSVLEDDGRSVQDYETSEAFLKAYDPSLEGCLLVDASLPGMSGVELLERLHADGRPLPAIVITGNGDVSIAVRAMKAGALDFIEKPVGAPELLASVDLALEHARDTTKLFAWRADAARQVAGLTPREHEIMELVLAGHPSKNIAADLGISQRTVETHRASVMKKTGSKSLPALARMALAAAANTAGAP
jgi:two-component system CheB/CheR fusion protein